MESDQAQILVERAALAELRYGTLPADDGGKMPFLRSAVVTRAMTAAVLAVGSLGVTILLVLQVAEFQPPQREKVAPQPEVAEVATVPSQNSLTEVPSFLIREAVVADRRGIRSFRYALERDPRRLCAALDRSGSTAQWAGSELMRGLWECYADQEGSEGEYGLFAIARGSEAGSVNEVRLKLRFKDEIPGSEAYELFTDRVRAVALTAGLPVDVLLDFVGLARERRTGEIRGVDLLLLRESLEVSAVNLILRFPDESQAGGSDTFVQTAMDSRTVTTVRSRSMSTSGEGLGSERLRAPELLRTAQGSAFLRIDQNATGSHE